MKKLLLILLFVATASASVFFNSFNSGVLNEDLKIRQDLDRVTMGSETLDNVLLRPQGMAFRRPGTEYIAPRVNEITLPETGTKGTYKLMWITQNAYIWGVPLLDQDMVYITAGDAVDVGGGIVGINYPNADEAGNLRLISGTIIQIAGTTNYNGVHTLTAGTTATQLQFTAAYGAETFDGTETLVVKLGPYTASSGRMCTDSSYNMYYGHNWNAAQGTFVTKIATDGTVSYDPVDNTIWLADGSRATYTMLGMAHYNGYLYTMRGTPSGKKLEKWNLSDGSSDWTATCNGGFDLDVDENGNAYCRNGSNIAKYDEADGAVTNLTNMGAPGDAGTLGGFQYVSVVDNDQDIIIGGGYQYQLIANNKPMYNFGVRTFDNTAGDTMELGGNYIDGALRTTYIIGTEHVAAYNSDIYVLAAGNIYQIDWDGSTLTEVKSIVAPTYAAGLFFDHWGNLVVVVLEAGGSGDNFWFYDTDLNYLTKVDGLPTGMLSSWVAGVGGAWQAGNIASYGALGDYVAPIDFDLSDADGVLNPVRLIPFEYSTNDAYVLEFGHRYISFLRTTQ